MMVVIGNTGACRDRQLQCFCFECMELGGGRGDGRVWYVCGIGMALQWCVVYIGGVLSGVGEEQCSSS